MKDFDSWNILKKNINNKNKNPDFSDADIWWVNLGANIGYEIDGKNDNFERPVLVIKKHNKETFLAVTLTSREKQNKWHIKIKQNDKEYIINTSQIRTISSKRLIRKISQISKKNLMNVIDIIISNQFSIKNENPLTGIFSDADGDLTNTLYKTDK